MGRREIETDNRQVHRILRKLSADAVSKRHPEIANIIKKAADQQLPLKRSCGVIFEVLQGCQAITTRAAADATGNRFARSTIAEYTMLARKASADIAAYLQAA